MKANEFTRLVDEWSVLCGTTEWLTEDKMLAAQHCIDESGGLDDKEKELSIITACLMARAALKGSPVVNDSMIEALLCASEVLALVKNQRDALKEKLRWHDDSIEPAPRGEEVLIRCLDYDGYETAIGKMERMYAPDGEPYFAEISWRPLNI